MRTNTYLVVAALSLSYLFDHNAAVAHYEFT